MIQILGLRDYTRDGRTLKAEKFFEKGWRTDKVQNIFDPRLNEELLSKIPLDEQWNLYFTVGDCFEEQGRKLREQWAIPFDIDGLNLIEGKEIEIATHVAELVCSALEIKFQDTAIVFTGNGVQLFVFTQSPIVEEDYFERTRMNYGVLCKKIQAKLDAAGVQGKTDVSVWSKARLMRLPNTENRKPNKPTRKSYIINTGGTAIAYDVVSASGVKMHDKAEVMPDVILKNYPKPDTKAVCSGCKFLVHCSTNAAAIQEPQWYAMVSITSRLDDGASLTHTYSGGHPDYNHYETENKIEQSLAAAGPRTCANIDSLWDGCKTCEHYGKVTSPIMIKGPDYIASNDFGFRERKKADGKIIAGKPAYLDLKKQYELEHQFKVLADNDQVIIYNGKHWEHTTDRDIKAWCMQKVRPEPTVNEMNEFTGILKAHNVTSIAKQQQSRDGLLNFDNCVLSLKDGRTFNHSPDFGFFDVRPYGYDSRATSPTFDKFVLDIMSGEEDRADLLKEFAGYCISGDQYWIQQALVLHGDGANGKSVFMEILADVVGPSSYSAVPLQELQKDTMRYQLVHKLFNYSEETSVAAFKDSSFFKTLISGGQMTVKQLYAQPYMTANQAKVIMSANKLPNYTDDSHGFLRRLVIVHFKERFNPGDGRHDYNIKDKLRLEVAGICNTLLKAYAKVKIRGYLSAQAKVNSAVQEYAEQNDTVLMFANDVLVPQESNELKASEVYAEYVQMCELGGHKPLNNISFAMHLTKKMGMKSEKITKNNKQYRVYKGYTLNKEY